MSIPNASPAGVADDREHPEEGQGTDDAFEDHAFDRRMGQAVVQAAALLGEQADLLIASSSISLESAPAGVLAAHMRPHLVAAGELENRAVARDRTVSCRTPLSRATYRDHAGLRAEIMLQIAIQLTWLEQG